MSPVLRLVRQVALVLLLHYIFSVLVLAQDKTSNEPLEPTSTNAFPIPPVITNQPAPPTIDPSFTTTATPRSTEDGCARFCLWKSAADNGCPNPKNPKCVCPKLDIIFLDTSLCLEHLGCYRSLSDMVLANLRKRCRKGASSSQTASNISESTSTQPSTSATTPSTTSPTPDPTNNAQGSYTSNIFTTIPTLSLTQGQVVTLEGTGTVLTTFTASSALIITQGATVLASNTAKGGSNAAAGYSLGAVVCLVSAVIGGFLVL